MPGFLPDSDSEDELPPGWIEKADENGKVFYVNQNQEVKWTHPRTGKAKRVRGDLPFGWEKRNNESGKILYVNTTTGQETFTDPRLAFASEIPTKNISDVRQRFDSGTTALQVLHGLDLSGKVAVVTGSNVGIGFETARSLVLHGCTVYFCCRNKKSTEDAIASIVKEKSSLGKQCKFIHLDLSTLKSVKEFCDNLKSEISHLNFLILNAGVFALPFSTTQDGLETTFQISHLSNFYLTNELSSLVDNRSRVIVLSSESHRFSNLSLENMDEQKLSPPASKYWSMMAYNNAKLCNVLFAIELAKRWKDRGISVFVCHPGNMVSSQLSRNYWFYRLMFALVRPFTKSLQQAASTTIFCATATELTGLTGLYFNNCFFCEPSKVSQIDEMQTKLWSISEKMVNDILNGTNFVF
ncbi:WWOX family protein [Megaselia abdita]